MLLLCPMLNQMEGMYFPTQWRFVTVNKIIVKDSKTPLSSPTDLIQYKCNDNPLKKKSKYELNLGREGLTSARVMDVF